MAEHFPQQRESRLRILKSTLGKVFKNGRRRRRSCCISYWQWVRNVQGWIRRRRCSKSRVSRHCRSPQAYGKLMVCYNLSNFYRLQIKKMYDILLGISFSVIGQMQKQSHNVALSIRIDSLLVIIRTLIYHS